MKSHSQRDLALINAAGFLRSFGVGLMGVVLGIHLSRVGLSSAEIGLVIASGLVGSALAIVVMSVAADRLGRKRFLVLLSLLSAVGGIALARPLSVPMLMTMVFVGMLNGTGTDRSAAFALDQAVVPGLVSDTRRTWSLAWYNVLLDGGGSLGARSAGLPLLLQQELSLSVFDSYRVLFFGYSALCLAVAALYLFLSPEIEVAVPVTLAATGTGIAPETRNIVARLTALFSLDAFGGGFLTDALVSYSFFRRFGIPEQGIVFFAVHILNAVSHLGAAWLARRIGLVNTMIFTRAIAADILHFPARVLVRQAAISWNAQRPCFQARFRRSSRATRGSRFSELRPGCTSPSRFGRTLGQHSIGTRPSTVVRKNSSVLARL